MCRVFKSIGSLIEVLRKNTSEIQIAIMMPVTARLPVETGPGTAIHPIPIHHMAFDFRQGG